MGLSYVCVFIISMHTFLLVNGPYIQIQNLVYSVSRWAAEEEEFPD